jgi:hypothetical protein
MGGIVVEVELANNDDLALARGGHLPPEQVRRARVAARVATGFTGVMLPPSVVSALGLPETGEVLVEFRDGRREAKKLVGDVWLGYEGRSGIFSAIVEPGRSDGLIGAIVLDALDLLADCGGRTLLPHDPANLTAKLG